MGRGRGVLGAALAVMLVGAPVARAAEPTSDAEGSEAAETPVEPQVKVFGRIFALGGADERNEFARELGIADARLGVKATYGFADAVVMADLASRNLLKDAYVRLRAGDRVRIYGGQFKAPFMLRELESTWDLPRIGRGFVESYLVDQHQLGGRRPGVMVEGKLGLVHGLRLSAGVFRGASNVDGTRTGEDASARVSARPFKALTVGTSGYVAEVMDGAKRFGAGGDATLRLGKLGLTGEALFGRLSIARFTSQTAQLTYDFPTAKAGWVLQPSVGGEALQLRGDVTGVGYGATVGFNATLEDRIRLQLQAERAQRPGDDRPANDLSVQVGARF